MTPALHSAIRALLRAEANAAADAGDDDAVNHLETLLDANRRHVTPESKLAAQLWLCSWSPTLRAAELEAR